MISKKQLEILRYLNRKQSYGYELIQELDKGGTSIYVHLNKLLEKKYIRIKEIKPKSERNKKIYEITQKGVKLLNIIDS